MVKVASRTSEKTSADMGAFSAKKILVLRSGALGDCVISIPTLRLLRERFKDSHITVVGDPYSAPVFANLPYFDRLIMLTHKGAIGSYLAQLMRLRRERFDLILDLQTSGRTRCQTVLVGAKRRIGFDKGHYLGNLPYTEVVALDRSIHASKRLANMLEVVGGGVSPAEVYSSPAPFARQAMVRELLEQIGVSGPYAILQVTTSGRTEDRVWPSDRFAAVAEHLTDLGLSVVIASRKNDQTVNEVIASARCPIYNLAGTTDLSTLMAVIGGASLYAGYNTGPMHIAAWLNVPIVALFDIPNDEFEWHPLTEAPYRLVKARNAPGSPEWRMDTVKVHEVTHAIDGLWAEREGIVLEERRLVSGLS